MLSSTSTTAAATDRPRFGQWLVRPIRIGDDEAPVLMMWLAAGLLAAACHYVGALCDPSTAGSPAFDFLLFSAWGLMALIVGTITSAGRNWPRSVTVVAHLITALGVSFLALYLCRMFMRSQPVRAPLLLVRDALVGMAAYGTAAMSFLIFRLIREIGESTRREAQLSAALAAAEVRDAGSAAERLRHFLAEIRERLRHSAERAEEFATAAAALMRAWLKARMSSCWTLADEIQLLDRETDIDRLRTGGRTRVSIDAEPLLLAHELHAGSIVDVWKEYAGSEGSDRDVQLVIRPRVEALAITAQIDGRVVAERLATASQTPPETPRVPLARTGRWVGTHRTLAACLAVFSAIVIGTTIIALHRAAIVAVPLAWLSFMFIRAALWISFAVLLSRLRPVASVRLGVLAVAAAVAGEVVFAALMHAFIFPPAPYGTRVRMATGMALTSVYFPTIITLALMNALAAIRSVAELVDRSEQEVEANARFRSAQLRALRWQVNPHLLFNALNSAAALIRSEPHLADRFLQQLESFYARIGQSRDREFVPLREELDLMEEYLRIEAVRFPSLRTKFAIEESLLDEEIPHLLLQPVIENAVKFGSPDQEVGISAERNAGGWSISVFSDVTAARSRTGAGMGLVILEERLRAHYGKGATLQCRRDRERNVATIAFSEGPRTP